MASPSLSATLNFVKKYPITLCGFSLLFMPSVHRLLLYFTPLLLSTAIFIVAMMSWGPNASSSERGTPNRSKPKLVSEHHEWAFDESMGMADEDEEEEHDEEHEKEIVGAKVSHTDKPSIHLRTQEISRKGEVEPDVGLKLRGELEPDPDLSKEGGSGNRGAVGTTGSEPDPDLAEANSDDAGSGANCQTVSVGTGTLASSVADCQGCAQDDAGMATTGAAEPDPDLHVEGVGMVAKQDDVQSHVHDGSVCAHDSVHRDDDADVQAPDISHYAHGDSHAGSCASHGMTHKHDDNGGHASQTQHKHVQEGVPAVVGERPSHYLQVCA